MGEKPPENEALTTYIAVIDGHSWRTWGAWRPRGARQSPHAEPKAGISRLPFLSL